MARSRGVELASARAVERRLIARMMVANGIAGAVVTTYLVLAAELPSGTSRLENLLTTAAAFVVGFVSLSGFAARRGRRILRPALHWLDARSAPSEAERALLLNLPRRVAFFQLPYWVTAAIVTGGAQQLFAKDPKPFFTIAGVMQGGLFAAAIGYLLAERLLRPLLAIALTSEPPGRGARIGIGGRLQLVWLIGSGIPFVGIAVTPVVAPHADLGVTVPMVFLAAAAFVSGALLTGAASRSISEPMRSVRAALTEVAAGKLDAALVVDDTGEIGELQRGFNDMVAGLREREQLADLFGRHVGSEVAKRALQEGASLGGEVRDVSALFVDIIGSTTMARERSAPEVVALLNEFFAVVVACVDEQGGWVNKFEGDGALCVFGAPIDQPDHAARALRSSLAIVRALRGIDAGIGVSSGAAVAGNVGTEQRLEYTVIGGPVNEAARLSDAAKTHACRVLVARASVDAAGEGASEWVDAGPVPLRGLPADFAVCRPRS